MIGRTDAPLAPGGRERARALAGVLAGKGIGAIFSSPLARAWETAEIIGRALGLGPVAVGDLREIDLGAFEGLPAAEAAGRYPGVWAARGLDLYRAAPPGGESYEGLAGRVLPAYRAALAGAAGDAVFVAHRAVIQVILAGEGGLAPEGAPGIRVDYGEMRVVRRE
jgi:probable phosphoglycerate mutase